MTEHLFGDLINCQNQLVKMEAEIYKEVKTFFENANRKAQLKIMLDEFNFLRVRSTEKYSQKSLKKFCKKFHLFLAWERVEDMTDYRNIEEAKVVVYEYGFGPGDVDDGDDSVNG